MKVKELKKMIKDWDDEIEIIMSKDAEGNNHSPLYDYNEGIYIPDSTYSGEFHSFEHIKEDPDWYNDEYMKELNLNGVKAICLWPIN